MKLVLSEPKLLKDSIAIISEMVNEVTFKIDKDKIEITAMDPASVSMILFKLLGSAFTEYNVEKETEIAVNLDNLNSILRRIKQTDSLTMEVDENARRLHLTSSNESGHKKKFNLSLIDLDEREQQTPDLNFLAKVEVPSNILMDAIDDMDIVSEGVSFSAEKGKLTITSEGRFNAATVEMTEDTGVKVDTTEDEKIISKYGIEYLKKISKGGKLANRATLQFGKNYPLKIDYAVMDKLILSFLLAPRGDND